MHRRLLLSVLLAPALLAACGAAGASGEAKRQLDEGRAFLAKQAKAPGVVRLPSGLMYKVIASGPADGPHPHLRDEVKVDYVGTLVDGTVFDSTRDKGEPAVLQLQGLIPAWMEALPRMRPGDEWDLYVPPELGYGEKGAGGVIPPDATLVFRIKLLGVLPAAGGAADA